MRERIVAATPLVSLLLFLFSGFVLEDWLLGLTFFLLIPLSALLYSRDIKRRLNQMMPLIALLVFLWLHFGFDLAHPGWIVFFAIPLSDTLLNGHLDARKGVTLAITITYLVLGIVLDDFWHPGWLMFLLIPIINTLFFPSKTVRFFSKGKTHIKSSVFEFMKEEDFDRDEDIDIQDDDEERKHHH